MDRLMRQWRDIRWTGLGRGLALSVTLHGLLLATLLITLPLPEADSVPEQQVVEVTLVEPPEPEPEEPEAEQSPQTEPSAPEPEQPPEAEPPAPEPPEPEVPQQEAAVVDPPPAPQPPPAPDGAEAGEAAAIPVLRPVFRFGEEDSGPRQALDGGSADPQGEPDVPDSQTAAQSQPGQPAPEPDQTQREPAKPEPVRPEQEAPGQSAPEPAGIALPEIALPEAQMPGSALAEPDPAAAPAEISGLAPESTADATVAPPGDALADAAATQFTSADEQPGPESLRSGLTDAGTLFSPVLTEDRAAMVAMGSLPREMRASQLCTTELREQLRNGATRYGIELLPSYRLDSGNLMAVNDAAFRADGSWYNLSFRCMVDDDAFRVVSFAHKVGSPIPRDQWAARGFPNF
tara:strand:- start:6349 stop:7560 length:1212 start_codon:yes stop_codon:yes gene_type:complete